MKLRKTPISQVNSNKINSYKNQGPNITNKKFERGETEKEYFKIKYI